MITAICPNCGAMGEVPIPGQYDEDGEQELEDCRLCEGTGHQSRIVFANVYSVQRCRGGPEEGGWWYDAGEPLGSIRVDGSWNKEAVRKFLLALYQDEQAPRGRGSVIGGPDVEVYFEPYFAEPFPQYRPHYE